MTTLSKILLVDDEPDLVQLIQYNLERAGFEVVTAADGVEGLRVAEVERPDLIVLDIMMPRMDGFAVCRKLRANPRLTNIPILMLTAKTAEEDQVKGLDVGADDYVRKPVSPRLLLSRIRALLRYPPSTAGQPQQEEVVRNENSNVIRIHDLLIDRERFIVIRKIGAQEDRIHLPRKEFELLFFLARQPGKVFSRKDLLDEIWGTDVHVIPRTVDVHVRKIRNRLGLGYIETVTRVGYRFKE